MSNPEHTPESTAASEAVKRKNRAQMTLILAIAMVSLGGSYLLFYFTQGADVWGTTNNGQWVEPALTTADLGWQSEETERVWWLWTLSEGCDDSCQASAKNLRALHILLNREADRVRRGYTDISGAQNASWMTQFPELQSVAVADRKHLVPGTYIIDPLGNLVFFYPPATEPKPILEDLKRLLKVSQIG